jgi:hypothetical protein
MSITISAEERDALYDRIVLRLNGIGDVHTVVQQENWEAAQRLGTEFSDLLRLVYTDLEWGEGERRERTLNTPADVLARAAQALERLHQKTVRSPKSTSVNSTRS